MKYSGNHVFHFTKFESALRIIATKTLRFGNFENMNDIAEAKRNVYSMISSNVINNELSKYQSISLTMDKESKRGFYIDPLWGHYAQGGNGVCLVFDLNKLSLGFINQFGKNAMMAPIKYSSDHSNAVFSEGETNNAIKKYIKENIEEIFFTKAVDWEYEQEFRLLIRSEQPNEILHFDNDVLTSVILCLPRIDNFIVSPEFIILKSLLKTIPIFRYTSSLGNKKLVDENGKMACNIPGEDLEILFE